MPVIWAIVVAVVAMILGAIDKTLGLLGLGLFSGYLFSQLQQRGEETAELKRRLDEHRNKIIELAEQLKTAPAAAPPTPEPEVARTAAAKVEETPTPKTPAQLLQLDLLDALEAATEAPPAAVETLLTLEAAPVIAEEITPASRPATTPPQKPEPVEDTSTLPGPIRWLMQGNPVAKIGVLLLFFGLAYLFKYATDHDMLPIELRLGMAAALAGGLLTIGWKLRIKNALFGLLLQGAAVGCLYLTIFAAYRLYDLLPQPLAFGLMLVVCAASVMLAVLQQAQSLAVAASLGGFLAPLLLSTGSGNYIGLFSYYLMLSSGILVVSLYQSWRSLNLIGFFFTFGVAGIWGVDHYRPEMYPACQAFLIAFLLIYGVISLLFAFRQPAKLKGFVDGTLVFGSPLVGFGLQYGLTKHWEFGPAFSALGFAAFYLPVSFWLIRQRADTGRLLAQAFFALGLSFITLAIPLGMDASWTALAWVLEGAGLIWVGSKQARRQMLWSGVALQLAAAIAWIIFMADQPTFIAGSCCGIVLALAWLAAAGVLARPGQRLPETKILSLILLAGGLLIWHSTVLWIVFHNSDRGDLFAYDLCPIYIVLITLSTLACHIIGQRLNWRALGHSSWLLWPGLLLAWSLTEPNAHRPIYGLGWFSWPLALGAALWLLRKRDELTPKHLITALHSTWLWLFAALAIVETLWHLDHALLFVQEWAAIAVVGLPAAIIVAIIFGVRRGLWPFKQHPAAWLGFGAAPLLLLMVGGLVLGNLFDGKVRELSVYIPFINPLELSAAAALLALIAWQRQVIITLNLPLILGPARVFVFSALAFWWGNGILLRLLATIGPIDWDVSDLWDSRIAQTSIALTWTILALALTWFAARHQKRTLWIAGASLLGVVVAKLFLVDSQSSGGLARAVAFIGVALLLLLIGYVAPLPPRVKTASENE